MVHEAVERTPHEIYARPDNEDGHGQATERIQLPDSRQAHQDQPDQDRHVGPNVRHEMLAVGLQYDRAARTANTKEQLADTKIDKPRAEGNDNAGFNGFDRLWWN